MEETGQLEWGLLWFDADSKKTLRQKVLDAATRYRVKYKMWPNLCYVHPSMLAGGDCTLIDGIRVTVLSTVLPHHFWIGVRNEKSNEKTLEGIDC